MINWKELEKFIAPGKVCTLVVMVDGKEIGAFSFNIETLAYKEILETKDPEPVKIADKVVEAKPAVATKTTKGKTKAVEPVKAEPVIEDDDDDESPFIDEDTGEVIEENKTEAVKEVVNNTIADSTSRNAGKTAEPERMTRDQIMAQSDNAEVRANEHSGSKSAEVDGGPVSANKPVEQTFGEDW